LLVWRGRAGAPCRGCDGSCLNAQCFQRLDRVAVSDSYRALLAPIVSQADVGRHAVLGRAAPVWTRVPVSRHLSQPPSETSSGNGLGLGSAKRCMRRPCAGNRIGVRVWRLPPGPRRRRRPGVIGFDLLRRAYAREQRLLARSNMAITPCARRDQRAHVPQASRLHPLSSVSPATGRFRPIARRSEVAVV